VATSLDCFGSAVEISRRRRGQVREKDRKLLIYGVLWVTAAVAIMVAFLATAVFELDW
jgi:hypothetical protein